MNNEIKSLTLLLLLFEMMFVLENPKNPNSKAWNGLTASPLSMILKLALDNNVPRNCNKYTMNNK